jgi:hypothetical protein
MCLSESLARYSEGADDTSCRQPFPGRPGLSQSRSRRVFQAFALRLFFQGTGVGVRHALFPIGTLLGASLSRALCSPTPLSAACGCLGLMAGPFRLFPVGIYRVRPLRPVRSLPAGSYSPDVVQTRLQFLVFASAP